MVITKVAVVGGGIIGMSSAVRVIESFRDIDVTVISEKFSPYTTGDGSAGFWNPYLLGDVDPLKLRQWCQDTFDFLFEISQSPFASDCGVGLLSAYELSETPIAEQPFDDVFLHYRNLTAKELRMFPQHYRYGSFFTTLYTECSRFLPQLMTRFKSKGGHIQKRRVEDLTELIGEFDVVINCPGVEAAKLVRDAEVSPIRGQTIRVKAPWIKHAIITDEFYILPNSEEVICGGTHQAGDWNTKIVQKDRDRIWKGCCELLPCLERAKILKEWVGLRPGRTRPRIERETIENSKGQKLEVIHNYGHGGSGVTLFWGCAKDVVDLMKQCVPASSRL